MPTSDFSEQHRHHIIWKDGDYIPWSEASIHCLSQTFQYGFGVFEGVRCYATSDGPAIFRLEDHTRRLFQSANILKIQIPYEKETLNEVQRDLIKRNNFQDAYIRPTVYLDNEFLGLHTELTSVHVVIAAIEWKNTYMSEEKFREGISLKTSSYERPSLRNGLNQAKANGMYLITLLASNEARRAGFDDALMLDINGYVAEGNAANIFMVKNNKLFTPFTTSALNGITRQTIFDIADRKKLPISEKQMTRDELYSADEVFLTGTASEVLPVKSIDDRLIGDGQPGPISQALQHDYFSIVRGKLANYNESWLSVVTETKQPEGQFL